MKFRFLIILLIFSFTAWGNPGPLPPHESNPEYFMQKAQLNAEQGKTDSAAWYYDQASLAYAAQQLWQQSVQARRAEANLYFSHRQSHLAIESYMFLLDSLRSYLQDTVRGEAYYNIGLSYARIARFLPALENMKSASLIRSRVYEPHHPTLADTYHMVGRLYFVIGDYRQSLRYQQKFMEIVQATESDSNHRLAEAYQYVGLSYSRLHEHNRALAYYQQTLDILLNDEERNLEGLASTYNNMGLVYGRMGKAEEELNYLLKAIAIREEENSAKATNYHNIGRAYYDLGNDTEALENLHRAARLKIKLTGTNHTTLATTYSELAIVHRSLQHYDSALHYLHQALKIEQSNYGAYGIALSDAYLELGKTYAQLEQPAKALGYYQQAIASLVQHYDSSRVDLQPGTDDMILDKRSVSSLLKEKASVLLQLFEEQNNIRYLQLAYESSKAAISLLESTFAELNDQASVSFLATNATAIYEQNLAISLLIQKHSPNTSLLPYVFSVMEKNKARLLLQNIAESRWKSSAALADSLLIQEAELKSQISYYEKLRFEESTRPEPDSLAVADIQNQLFSMRQALEALQAAIRTQNPQKPGLLYQAQSASLDEIQQLLQKHELMIEYFAGEKNIYGMAISRSGAELLLLSDSETLPKISEQLTYGLRQQDYQNYAEGAYQAYLNWVGKFDQMNAPQTTRLIIVPDGQLGYLPFEALLTQKPPNRAAYDQLNYLIRDYTVAYQYSASLLTQQPGQRTYTSAFSGYAPDFDRQSNPLLATRSARDQQLVNELQALPYAREEVLGIARLFSGKAFTAAQATESMFKQTASQARILHLASHTLINDQEPLYSKLVFSQGEQSDEDGLLHTYELYHMHLPAEMVTLSACNTGLGKIKAGEGIISLARGFMYAGVSNVLMSLWSVSDRSTSQLMHFFYQSLKEGENKAEALRTAKLRYLAQADANTAAPYYWSGFVLISGELGKESTSLTWLYFASILAAAIFGSWFLFKKKIF